MGFISRNVELEKPLQLSPWRKIAIGTWSKIGDPSIYAMVDLEVAPALEYLEDLKKQSGQRITLSHFVGKAIAETMRRHPSINCLLRWGRLYPRKTIDVFFQVATDQYGKDLSGMTIKNADQKSIPEIAQEMEFRVLQIRKEKDPAFSKMKSNLQWVPGFFTRWILGAAGFINYTLNLWSPALGTPRDAFGGVMVTNIGSLGLDMAFAPLVPYSRVPILIVLGNVREIPVVKEGKVVPAQAIRLCVTIDHRLIDGVHAAKMDRTLKKIFADPRAELAHKVSESSS
jgi:pyruvate dehydrogenase E2 component (dihydrolipoamide acetyltransferase)